MKKPNALAKSLLLALVLSSCSSIPPASKPVDVPGPRLAPAPTDVMVQRQANFRQRLLLIFSPSSTTPTTSPANSPPPSK